MHLWWNFNSDGNACVLEYYVVKMPLLLACNAIWTINCDIVTFCVSFLVVLFFFIQGLPACEQKTKKTKIQPYCILNFSIWNLFSFYSRYLFLTQVLYFNIMYEELCYICSNQDFACDLQYSNANAIKLLGFAS